MCTDIRNSDQPERTRVIMTFQSIWRLMKTIQKIGRSSSRTASASWSSPCLWRWRERRISGSMSQSRYQQRSRQRRHAGSGPEVKRMMAAMAARAWTRRLVMAVPWCWLKAKQFRNTFLVPRQRAGLHWPKNFRIWINCDEQPDRASPSVRPGVVGLTPKATPTQQMMKGKSWFHVEVNVPKWVRERTDAESKIFWS